MCEGIIGIADEFEVSFSYYYTCVLPLQVIQSTHKMSRILLLGLMAIAVFAAEKDDKPDIGTVIGIDLGTTYSW